MKKSDEEDEDNQPFVNSITHHHCTDLTFLYMYILQTSLIYKKNRNENVGSFRRYPSKRMLLFAHD
jgi:hypothetical protein